MRSGWTIGAILLLALSAACSKHPDGNTIGFADNAAEAQHALVPTDATATLPAAPRTVAEIARILTSARPPFVDGEGFSMTQSMTCETAPPGERWGARCKAPVNDAARDQPGEVGLVLFDHDEDFEWVKTSLKARFDVAANQWTYSEDTSYTITEKNGSARKFPAWCVQSLGASNGLGACVTMLRPRVIAIASVAPIERSSTGIEENAARRDSVHAGAMLGRFVVEADRYF